jgi:hypothetical protein
MIFHQRHMPALDKILMGASGNFLFGAIHKSSESSASHATVMVRRERRLLRFSEVTLCERTRRNEKALLSLAAFSDLRLQLTHLR